MAKASSFSQGREVGQPMTGQQAQDFAAGFADRCSKNANAPVGKKAGAIPWQTIITFIMGLINGQCKPPTPPAALDVIATSAREARKLAKGKIPTRFKSAYKGLTQYVPDEAVRVDVLQAVTSQASAECDQCAQALAGAGQLDAAEFTRRFGAPDANDDE
jgi:hypothetical protein